MWDGLEVDIDGKPTIVCNGLLRDWASWILQDGNSAKNMREVLVHLSPSKDRWDRLEPGPLTRISVNDVRDIPSLRTGYAKAIPILHASSGVRRVVALAYMLLWSWNENRLAARQLGESPAAQVVLLIDELESHLHPRWQRSILGSLLKLTSRLHTLATIQLITATHSPLVLASAEPTFDPEKDAWFDLDLSHNSKGERVYLEKRDFVCRGDVSNWLTSEAFDLKEPRSIEAEEAITEALVVVQDPSIPPKKKIDEFDLLARRSLSDVDRFWVSWSEFRRRREADS